MMKIYPIAQNLCEASADPESTLRRVNSDRPPSHQKAIDRPYAACKLFA